MSSEDRQFNCAAHAGTWATSARVDASMVSGSLAPGLLPRPRHTVDVCTPLTRPTCPLPGQPAPQGFLIRFRPETSGLLASLPARLSFRHGRRAPDCLHAPAIAWVENLPLNSMNGPGDPGNDGEALQHRCRASWGYRATSARVRSRSFSTRTGDVGYITSRASSAASHCLVKPSMRRFRMPGVTWAYRAETEPSM